MTVLQRFKVGVPNEIFGSFNFKVKKFSFEGLNWKSASHKLLIRLWGVKKKSASRLDITPWSYKSLKIYPEIEVWKNEKIDFFDRECIYFTCFSSR